MRSFIKTLLFACMLGLATLGLSALTPAELEIVLETVNKAYPGALVLEISIESGWGGPMINVELDNKQEVYIDGVNGGIVRRERNLLGRDERRIAQLIKNGEVPSIPNLYTRVNEQLAASDAWAYLTEEEPAGIGFDFEDGRPVFQIEYLNDIELFADARTGNILMVGRDS